MSYLKVDKFYKTVFNANKETILEINEHFEDCNYRDSSVPINICPCDCYNMQIFNLGRQAESVDKDIIIINNEEKRIAQTRFLDAMKKSSNKK